MGLLEVVIMIAGSSGFAGLIGVFAGRRVRRSTVEKNEAATAQSLSETAVTLIDPLKEQVDQLGKRLRDAEKRAYDLEVQLDRMTKKLELANAELERNGLRRVS